MTCWAAGEMLSVMRLKAFGAFTEKDNTQRGCAFQKNPLLLRVTTQLRLPPKYSYSNSEPQSRHLPFYSPSLDGFQRMKKRRADTSARRTTSPPFGTSQPLSLPPAPSSLFLRRSHSFFFSQICFLSAGNLQLHALFPSLSFTVLLSVLVFSLFLPQNSYADQQIYSPLILFVCFLFRVVFVYFLQPRMETKKN